MKELNTVRQVQISRRDIYRKSGNATDISHTAQSNGDPPGRGAGSASMSTVGQTLQFHPDICCLESLKAVDWAPSGGIRPIDHLRVNQGRSRTIFAAGSHCAVRKRLFPARLPLAEYAWWLCVAGSNTSGTIGLNERILGQVCGGYPGDKALTLIRCSSNPNNLDGVTH